MTGTSGGWDLELIDGSTVVGLQLVSIRDSKGNLLPYKTIQGALAAADADSPLDDWLESVTDSDWFGGVGISYNQAPGCYTRTPGSVLPAGAVSAAITIPAGGSNTPIVAFEEFGGDVFAAEEGDGTTGGRVLRLVGGTGTAFVDSGVGLAAGDVIRDLCVFDDGAGTNRLYVSYTTPGFANGQLKYWNGVGWSLPSGLFVGNTARGRMKRVFWVIDGVGAWRLVSITGAQTIAYTRPNADPMTPASWVEGAFRVVTDTYLDELAAARRHIWAGTKTDVHDLTENGDSPGLMGYQNRTPTGIRFPLQYLDGYIYRAGANTLDRIRVDDGAVLQENPGNCAPGYGTHAENEWRGYPTALTVEQGYLVCAIYNPTTSKTGIFWGKDRRTLGVNTPNPLVWYGPEIVSAGARRVTAMMPSMLAGDRRLWIGSLGVANVPEIVWASLPVAGAPLQDLLSGGAHRFALGDGVGDWNATCQLWSLPQSWDDPVSNKIIDANGVTSRGLDGSTVMLVYNRADPSPGSSAWGTGVRFMASPVQNGAPVEATSGYQHEYRVDFASPLGTATPAQVAVLNAFRRTAWKRSPAFLTYTLEVAWGDGVKNRQNGTDGTFAPGANTTAIKLMTEAGRVVLRTPDNTRYSVVLKQRFPFAEKLTSGGEYGKSVTAEIVVAILGTA